VSGARGLRQVEPSCPVPVPPRQRSGGTDFALRYAADDEPMPVAAREKPQDVLHEALHTQ
jgi:hypothetical protein